MILSDGEIQEEIRRKRIIIDPPASEERYTTSALDLLLGDELLELKTLEELAKDEPAGVERPLIVDPARVDLKVLLQKYAKPLPRETDGSFVLQPRKFVLGITRVYIELPSIQNRSSGRGPKYPCSPGVSGTSNGAYDPCWLCWAYYLGDV